MEIWKGVCFFVKRTPFCCSINRSPRTAQECIFQDLNPICIWHAPKYTELETKVATFPNFDIHVMNTYECIHEYLSLMIHDYLYMNIYKIQ